MKNRVLILNGYPRSGKDTFAKFLQKHYNDKDIDAYILSSVKNVKSAAGVLGWDGSKNESNRKALHELKILSSKYWDGPFEMMSSLANKLTENQCLILMIREPEEIERFVQTYPDTVTIFVERIEHELADNYADQEVEEYLYDLYVLNHASLEFMESTAESFVEHDILHKGYKNFLRKFDEIMDGR